MMRLRQFNRFMIGLKRYLQSNGGVDDSSGSAVQMRYGMQRWLGGVECRGG